MARSRAARPSSIARRALLDTGIAAASAAPAQLTLAGASQPASASSESRMTMHLLMPKTIKHRKPAKPVVKPFRHSAKWKFRGYASTNNKPVFGKYALQALEEAWISSKQIETIRRTIVRVMERKGKIWIKIFPSKAITQRVAESRMGAGKGAIEYWVQAVRPNCILFEMDGVTEETARIAFKKAASKLPCKSRFVMKSDGPSRFEMGLAGKAGRGAGGPPGGFPGRG